MVLNGFEIEKKCDAEPGLAIEIACQRLTAAGYTLKERKGLQAALKFHGHFFASRIEAHTHHLILSARPGALHFEFSTGVVASYWTDADRQRIESKLVDEVLAAIASAQQPPGAPEPLPPAPMGMARCRFCQKLNLVEAEICASCGAAVFC